MEPLRVNVLALIYYLGDCRMNQDHRVADHETEVAKDNVVAVVVEVGCPPDEVVAHRQRRHKAMVAVSMDLAYWLAEGVRSCCATQRRSRLPTYDERDLDVRARMD